MVGSKPTSNWNKWGLAYLSLPPIFSTTVIVGLGLVLLMNASLFPEIRIAGVPLPTSSTLFAGNRNTIRRFDQELLA